MSGRTEMSTTLQDPKDEAGRATSVVIALIGPNATHRRVMAKALTGVPGRTVREFSDYPAGLSEIPNIMEEGFDVVMIDVDSDQSFALQIVETIAALNTAIVMVYSMRNDADLLRDCMRAGARDFLPLPDENDGPAGTSSTVEAQAAPEAAEEAEPEPVPSPAPELSEVEIPLPEMESATPLFAVSSPQAAREDLDDGPQLNPADFLLPPGRTASLSAAPPESEAPLNPADFLLPGAGISMPRPVTPEPGTYEVPSRPQFIEPHRPDAQPAHQRSREARPNSIPDAQHKAADPAATGTAAEDFSAWDTQWILSAKAAAKAADQAASVPEPAAKKKADRAPAHSGPQLVSRAAEQASVAEKSAAAAPLFQPIDADKTENPRPQWMRWAIIAGIPMVVIGLGMLIFMTPSHPRTPAANQQQAAISQPAPTADVSVSQKPSASTATAKPSAGTPVETDQPKAAQAPVAADMMNAQLAAPSRIAGQVNKSDSGEAAPDSFSPNALGNGASMPGQIFNGSGNLKIVPGVSAISAGVAEGMLIHRTDPVYPEFAKSAHVSGTIVLAGQITKSGSLVGLHVLSGPAILRGPALDAVKSWRYRPYMLNNEPVEVQTTIKVIFSLDRR